MSKEADFSLGAIHKNWQKKTQKFKAPSSFAKSSMFGIFCSHQSDFNACKVTKS